MSYIQKQLQHAVDELVESGAERGVQVSVYRHGRPLAEVVAGVADPETGREVLPGTPFYNFSIGKGATATVAHVGVERGWFGPAGYDTRVVELWPEFGAHGKGEVTLRHILTHSAGVPGVPAGTTVADVCDWDTMCAGIAACEPWWAPGTAVGYHAYTFGYLVGELVRRATGRGIGQVLREEITAPLGVADELWFGMPEAEQLRLARLEDGPSGDFDMSQLPEDMPMLKASPVHLFPSADFGNRPDVLAADIPAGAKTSARAIARMYAALLDEVDGVRLLSPDRTREATTLTAGGTDQVFGNESRWGLGYSIGLPDGATEGAGTVFGMGGAGGSWAGADTATGTSWAITKNVLSADFATANRLTEIIRAA
ncbi:serine hydrolase domain-containing protein [Streptomyces sp. NPDC051561]|uniref:serine hydrolase domain-containing protein n=1 Tax=Streptomyces sp. NPDC051561 TaxID=3365658 RepID=UPI0037913927